MADHRAVSLDCAQVKAIRHALLIGLASYGEIERLSNEYDTAKLLAEPRLLNDMKPIHPTGAAETISEFAEALRFLDVGDGSGAHHG